jgi:hypothetical protein
MRPTRRRQTGPTMGRSRKTSRRLAGRMFDRLVLGGKKTAVALGLVGIMAFMWARVLTGHKPGTAAAADEPVPPVAVRPELPPKMRLIKLPRIVGRNDFIYRDFFTMQDRACFKPNGSARAAGTDPEVRVIATNHAQEVVHRVMQKRKLRLEAVLHWSVDPQVFLNDQLLRVGDKFTVKDETDSVEFEVLRIYENSVLVGSGGTQVTLEVLK